MTIHLKLQQIAKYRRGSFPQPYGNSDWYDGEGAMPFVQVADVEENSMRLKETTKQKISRLAMPKSVFVPKGTVIVTLQGSIGKVAITQYDSYVDRTLGIFENYIIDIDKKYFALQLEKIFSIKRKKARGGTIKTITKEEFSDFLIPIPSLEEQQRIVEQLDTFTSSIENLKEQIAQRRKQYEYYRDQLLDLEGKEGVDMKMLGEIGRCVAGATPSTKISEYWEGGNIPWMSSGEVHQKKVTHTSSFITQKGYENASTKMLPAGTIVIALAGQGKTRGSVAITAIELCTNQSLCGVIINDTQIINKYVYYYMTTRYDDLRRISSGDGTRGGLNLKMISSYYIPLPPLSEQQRIVSILDTFEASIQNLEAQLEQRQKQYEYYRNKLLTFE